MIGHLAIVGATGAVGREMIRVLEERNLKPERLSLFASAQSAGQSIEAFGEPVIVKELTEQSFAGVDIALFSAGGERSRRFAPVALDGGTVVVDNSSAFRMEPVVPLVIPEINIGDLRQHRGLIANPNCSTIILLMVIAPLHRFCRIERAVVSTYQAASGAGAAAMAELASQTRAVLEGKNPRGVVFPHPTAFNLFIHESPIGEDGYNAEERKMIQETRKILAEPDFRLSVTCVRVPVMRAHSESINLTFADHVSVQQVQEILSQSEGVRIVDDAAASHFPMPVEASGVDEVLVGHIREDAGQPERRGIELFVSGDQLRKGAALNAVQIVERLV